ncbi:MAG: amidase [Verrucomicrobia bacterium]|nr:amidase [Verrucomicrobiota bacterium]
MPLSRRRFLASSSVSGLAAALPGASTVRAADPTSVSTPPGAVTAATLSAAETLAGLQFTAEQRASLVKSVAERAYRLAELRTPPLPNHVFPVTTFDPRLAGIAPLAANPAIPAPKEQPPVAVRPASEEDLAFLPVTQLSALLRSRQVTSQELTELALARLKRFDPAISAVVTLTEERARLKAEAADAELRAGRWRGPLHGIPWGAKDLLSVRGYPTTWGAAQFRTRVLDEDATVVRRLDAAGAVLVAKLSLGALASGDNWFGGQTKCPWNLATGSSGSSAGSCAAVSAGLVPFAIGSETLGSIVSPATRNGVTGFRPSYGRISRAGAMALSWSMDKLGPIARTAEDCALVFSVIHGADPADPTAVDAAFEWPSATDLRGVRIGVPRGVFGEKEESRAADDAALAVLRQRGAELVPFDLPPAPVQTLRLVLTVEAAAAFDDFTRSGDIDTLLAPRPSNWATSLRAARYIPAVDYVQANRRRTLLIRELEETLASLEVSVWVSPPAGNPLVLTNLTGHPSVCVPTGFLPVPGAAPDSPRRTAQAMTFHARFYHDDRALTAAHAFQQATDWHRRRPPVV